MKKLLTLSSLAIIALTAAAEAARFAGLPVPSALTIGTAFLALSVTTFMLVLVADYGRKTRPITLRMARPACVIPARRSIAAAHHHVYAIRRGVEAARLAHVPARPVHFPRRQVQTQKAA